MLSETTCPCPSEDDSRPAPAPLSVRLVTLAAVLLPLLGLAGALVMVWTAPFHWIYLTLFGAMYLLTALGIGVGYHRLYTHKAYDAEPVVRFVWGVLGSMAVEGPLLRWVAVHRKHHQHTDVPGDPHSPHACGHDGPGAGGVLRGLWHAHVGWIFDDYPPDLPRYVPDLLKDPVAVFVDRWFALWVALGLIAPAVIGGVLSHSWQGALQGFLWGGMARVLLVHHVTWSINSVCHLWGTRPFRTRDESRDNPVLGILALGEGWHNAHHAFPGSARHGLAWWKLDINYLVIKGMALLHLARNVRVPSAERVEGLRRSRAA